MHPSLCLCSTTKVPVQYHKGQRCDAGARTPLCACAVPQRCLCSTTKVKGVTQERAPLFVPVQYHKGQRCDAGARTPLCASVHSRPHSCCNKHQDWRVCLCTLCVHVSKLCALCAHVPNLACVFVHSLRACEQGEVHPFHKQGTGACVCLSCACLQACAVYSGGWVSKSR